jgi:hypothetical protein
MQASVRARARGEKHTWEPVRVAASVKQVRLGHPESDRSRLYAQITCQLDAAIAFTAQDAGGEVLIRSGTQDAPFALSDLWVFERCITVPLDVPGANWKLKERILDSTQQSSAVRLAKLNQGPSEGKRPKKRTRR